MTFLPEPDRRDRHVPVISVDDHIVEPPDMFIGRMPAKCSERAPRVVVKDDGTEAWLYDGIEIPKIGLNAVAGKPVRDYSRDPVNFADRRKGAWDIHSRIADTDVCGVYASLNFSSFLTGFGGGRLQSTTDDYDLALAATRARTDWHLAD